jgi:imidazolonepropionase-like amidohydrolase
MIGSEVIGFSPIDEAEAIEAARRAKREGADFLKVHDNVSRAAYFALVEEAKKLGLTIAGHVPKSVTAEEAARAGQRSIEHLTGITAATSELIDLFKQHDTWQCPTLMMRRNYARLPDQAMTRDSRLTYVKPSWRQRWKRMSEEALKWPADEAPRRMETVRKEFAMVAAMNRAGVRILAGTDDGNPYSLVGFGLHDELQALVDAGLTPMQALQTATRNPGRFMNTDGTIARGKVANLVLLNANPLEDIANTRDIDTVIVRGAVFDRAELDAILTNARGDGSVTVSDGARILLNSLPQRGSCE